MYAYCAKVLTASVVDSDIGSLLVLISVFLFLGFINEPFGFSLNSGFEGTMIVDSSVASNDGVPPELVDCEGTEEYIGVVHFVVVANP
jgi:hypothetical protein